MVLPYCVTFSSCAVDSKSGGDNELRDLEKWESSFHEVGAVFIGPDGKDEEEAQALRMAERAPALPAAADLLSGRRRLRSVDYGQPTPSE